MSIENKREYRNIVKGIAANIVAIAMEEELDTFGYNEDDKTIDIQALLEFIQNKDLIHEQVDSSQYLIYNRYHSDILKYSDNDNALLDENLGDCLGDCTSFLDVASQFAYWALYRDVCDELNENVDEYVVL